MPSLEVSKYNPNTKGFDKPTIKTDIEPEDFMMIHEYIQNAQAVMNFYKVTITTDNGVAEGIFTPHPDLVGYLKAQNKKTPHGQESNS